LLKGFALAIAVWYLLPLLVGSHALFPSVGQVLHSLVNEFSNGNLPRHFFDTSMRLVVGLFVGLAVGFPLGVAITLSGRLREWIMPSIEFLRAIPTAMLFPVAIVLFGLGELARTMIVAYATFPIIVVAIIASESIETEGRNRDLYVRLNRSFLPRRLLLEHTLWRSLPGVISGLKIAASVGIVLVIVSEMFFVAESGLGRAGILYYQAYAFDAMAVYVIAAGLLGLLVNGVFDLTSGKILGVIRGDQ
jgi:sulfonate transport system permease protein